MGTTGDDARPAEARATTETASGRRTWLVIGAAVVILVGAAVLLYGFTRPSSAPEPSLSATATAPPGTYTLDLDHVAGTWKLAPDDQSWVGYRINEKYLNPLTDETVTGRTGAVKAYLGIRGRDVSVVAVEADLTQLKSDDAKRDDALKTRGLETERFPRAVFALTQDVNLTSVPPPGTEATFHAVGEINLHGTRRPLEVDLKAQLIPGAPVMIEVVGVQTIDLHDFGIEPPDVAGLLEVRDQGALEFKLRFVPDTR